MIKRFKNWKTTVTAIVIAVITGLQWEHGTALAEILTQVIAFIALILAKD